MGLTWRGMNLYHDTTDDVLVRMMDDRTAESSRSLFGHNGPVFSMSFSPDRNLLLSSSEDSTGTLQR